MKTFVSLVVGLATLSSALEHPDLRKTRDNDRVLQRFWEQGYCEGQLSECSTIVSAQKTAFPLSGIIGMLSGLNGNTGEYYDYEYVIDSLRQSIANLEAVNYTEMSDALTTLTETGDPESVKSLEETTDQLRSSVMDALSGFPDMNANPITLLQDELTGILSVDRFANLSFNGFNEVILLLDLISTVVVSPVALLGVLSTTTNGLIAIANSLVRLATGFTGVDFSFCLAELITCTFNRMSLNLVIVVSEAVIGLVELLPTETDDAYRE